MVGSLHAAEAGNGEAAAPERGSLRRFCFALTVAALLAACGHAPDAAPSIAAAPAAFDTTGLSGLSAAQLVARYGKPDFRRSDPPAQLWQYRRAGCVLDVFLYRDAGVFRVAHAEARSSGLIEVVGSCGDGGAPAAPVTRQSLL